MSIKATIDNTDYNGVDTIVVGGKTISLTEIASGALPAGFAEIQTGTFTRSSDSSTTKTITHGCSEKPSIIILDSDFRTRYTADSKPSNTTLVMATWFARGMKTTSCISTSFAGGNSSTSNAVSTASGTLDGSIANVNDTTFDIGFINTRRNGGGLTYRWYAIVLGSDEFTGDN